MDSLPKAHMKQNNLLDAIDVYNTAKYNRNMGIFIAIDSKTIEREEV